MTYEKLKSSFRDGNVYKTLHPYTRMYGGSQSIYRSVPRSSVLGETVSLPFYAPPNEPPPRVRNPHQCPQTQPPPGYAPPQRPPPRQGRGGLLRTLLFTSSSGCCVNDYQSLIGMRRL